MTQSTMRLSVLIDGQSREATVALRDVEGALNKVKGSAAQAGQSVEQAMTRSSRAAADAARLTNQQLAGMQFQLNDIAVGLASGQSPFTVMMQQGMQLSQSFTGGTGVMAALKQVGQGFVQFLTNPLNLAVLGFGLAATAGQSFFRSLTEASPGLEEALERQEELVGRIRDRYTEAGRAAEAYGLTSRAEDLRQARDSQRSFETDLSRQMGQLPDALFGKVMDPLLSEAERLAARQRALAEDYGVFGEAVNRLITDIEAGKGNILSFRDQVAAIAEKAKDNAGIQATAKGLQDITRDAVSAATNVEKSAAAARVLDGSATVLDKRLLGVSTAMDGLSGASGRLADKLRQAGNPSYFGDIPAGNKARDASGLSILDLIGKFEGTDIGRGYNETLGYGRFTGGNVELVTMTLREVRELQRKMLADPRNSFNSSAVGRYQLTGQTIDDFMPRLGLTGDSIFSKEVQDRIALAIINAAKGDIGVMRGRWPSLTGVGAGDIRDALGLSASDRSAAAELEQTTRLEAQRLKDRQLEVGLAEMRRRIEQEITAEKRQQDEEARKAAQVALELQREQLAFYNQFRGFTDGLAGEIARVKEETGSWTKAGLAGLDAMEKKAMGFLEKFIDKMLDAALFGAEGTTGGGLLGGFVSGLGNLFGGMFNPSQNAFGNAFRNGQVTAFATGGIVGSPTLFPMRSGVGLMGEAGPEAIMPLTRTPSGHLGVRSAGGSGMKVNIHNYGGSQVEARERPNGNGGFDIDILVGKLVDQHLASGRGDKAMSRFGVAPLAQRWG